MRLLAAAANGAWIVSSLPAAAAFRRDLDRVADVQLAILFRILRRNADTTFGRAHRFASIRSFAEYRDCVPVRTYEDFAPELGRVETGEPNVLTASAVDHFEPTSGSSGPSKLIPHTRELREELGRAFAPWICASATSNPRAFAGPAYWSLSPVGVRPRRTAAGIRIGFDRDDEYLGRLRGALARAAQAVPARVGRIEDVDEFRRETLRCLVACQSLSMISVWHPSFLAMLVAPLGGDPERHRALWPQLRAISCWTDAGCASPAAELARLFPHVCIEPKGLLSTEGIVSIPIGAKAPALAYRSHVYELQEADGGAVVPACEGEVGGRYGVVITTGGGLYRYATEDLVEIIGFAGSCPLLRFVGRKSHVSDRFGEKLNEVFVRDRLDRALREEDVSAAFAMLAPEGGRYALFIKSEQAVSAVADRLDLLLRESFHYDYCRRLGQLGPLVVIRVDGDPLAAIARETNQRLGEVKPAALDGREGWAARFTLR